MNLSTLLHDKAEAKQKASAAIDAAVNANRDMTPAENEQYQRSLGQLKDFDNQLERMAQSLECSNLHSTGSKNKSKLSALPEMHKLEEFLRHGTETNFGKYEAALTTGTQSSLIPSQVEGQVIDNVPGADPYVQVGATFFDTETGTPINVPVFGAGADFGISAEGSNASSSQDPTTYVLQFGQPTKYSRLVKISDEALSDLGFDVGQSIVNELVKTLAFGYAKVTTQGLVTSLIANTPLVSSGMDLYSTLVSLITAIHPLYASDSNKFMMSRAILGELLDARDLQGRPLITPDTNRVFGKFDIVINDHLGHIVFGDFQSGVFIRRTPLVLRRLVELYAEQGEVGIRLERRLDSKYFSTVTSGAGPQPLAMAAHDFGS